MGLKFNARIGKKIRSDSVDELGLHTKTLVKKAIRAGRKKEAEELLEYMDQEHQVFQSSLYSVMQIMETYISEKVGEDQMGELWKYIVQKNAANRPAWGRNRIPNNEGWTPQDFLLHAAEVERGMFTEQKFREEEDRYVEVMSICGGCGRMRRTGESQGVTQKAYTWSWGKKGVPYHCCHKAVLLEILRYQNGKVPILTDWSEDPDKPCVTYIYKDPKKAVAVFRERLEKMLEEGVIEDKEEARRLLSVKFNYNENQYGGGYVKKH